MKHFNKIFLSFFLVGQMLMLTQAYAQEAQDFEKQLWAMVLLNFRMNDKWTFNQDFGYQHSYETPTFTRLFTRQQFNRQLTGSLSLHGGLIFMYKFNELDNNAYEIRPWMGAKVSWPHVWRFDFVHYLRFEQRFEHTLNVNDWENNFRLRYKLGSNLPINHNSIVDHTFYGLFYYEFYSESFGNDIRITNAAAHRYDIGIGYRQNVKNRYEALFVALHARDDEDKGYTFSSAVLFLRYKRYINWE